MSSKRLQVYPPNPNTNRGTSTKLSSNGDKIAYANGKSMTVRDLNNPAHVIVYSGHVQPTTVVRISPSGYYAASADILGNVRVWDTVGQDQVLKGEYKVLSGKINDLTWDGESKRIIAVGDGREKFGHAFQYDSGSSAGEIAGHSKAINAVSIRHQRPFRAATAGDDGQIVFHTGVPYKYDKTIKTHTKFVQDVQFAPSGEQFISVGSDAKAFLYDGKTGDHVAELVDAHAGTIFAGSWAPDNKNVVTSSADCTVKLWDVETRKTVSKWTLGAGVEHQQVGNTWAGTESIVSLSMSGELNVFDRREGKGPTRVLFGPQKSITSTTMATSPPTFFAGSADGRIHSVSLASLSDTIERVQGQGHTNLVSGIASAKGSSTWSVGYDDSVREVVLEGNEGFTGTLYETASQPKGVAVAADGYVFVAETGHVEVVRSGQKVCSVGAGYGTMSVDVSGGIVAVGGEDAKVHLYASSADGTLKDDGILEGSHKGPVSAVAFSPDGVLLAAGDSTGKIVVYNVKERKASISRWTFHSSRIHSLAWTSDSAYVASGSLDTHVYVWSVAKPTKNIAIKNAGPGGVWGVNWLPNEDGRKQSKLVSAGADSCVRVWEVVFHT